MLGQPCISLSVVCHIDIDVYSNISPLLLLLRYVATAVPSAFMLSIYSSHTKMKLSCFSFRAKWITELTKEKWILLSDL